MEQQDLGFYVILSSEILLAEDISDGQKLLLALISGLSKQNQWCTASNDYLAKCVNKNVGSVSNAVSDLVKKGYLVRQVIRTENHEFVSRKLAVRNVSIEVLDELKKMDNLSGTPPHKKMDTPPHKIMDTPPLKNGYPSPLKNGLYNTYNKLDSISTNSNDKLDSVSNKKTNKIKKALFSENFEKPLSFREELLETWYAYKAEKKQAYKPKGKAALVKMLEKFNDEQLREAIEHSMANNYQGIFAPKVQHNLKPVVKPDYNQGLANDQLMVASWRRKHVTQDPNWTPDTVN